MSDQAATLLPSALSLSELSSAEEMPDSPDPIPSRPRSDTLMTTSSASSSSSPLLQTPPTPSILGVLDGPPRHRADSYGFGEFSKALFPDGMIDRRVSAPEDTTTLEERIVEALLSGSEPRAELHVPALEPGGQTFAPSQIQTPTLSAPVSLLLSPWHAAQASSGETESEARGQIKGKGKARAGSAVRSKLQRSKSSLKEVLRIGTAGSALDRRPDDALSGEGDETETDDRRRRPRLRGLLSFSNSRASSTASIHTQRTGASFVSIGDQTSLTQVETQTAAASSLPVPNTNLVARDFAIATPGPSRTTGVESDLETNNAVPFNEIDHLSHLMISPRPHRRVRPMPKSALSTTRITQLPRPAPPMTRSATAPVLAEGSFRKVATWQEQRQKDLFDTMLPRELKVMVLKTMLEMGCEQEREARWDGEVGARRDLIRLSRVSKGWQALCFDGQLWPMLDLTPYVSHLHPKTLRRLVDHAGPFVKTLSLKGMDALKGSDLVIALAASQTRYGSSGLDSLTELDLRGCKKLDSTALLAIIQAAPNLRIVNLKGVQAVSSEVIRTLARTATRLESLDVSRCWDISLCDICVFIKMLPTDQAARLRVLRVGGMKAYGSTASDFLPSVFDRLVNLDTLDLLGCTHIFDPDMIKACELMAEQSRPSSLRHLILSGCLSLSHAVFPAMRNMFPNLTRFELASIPEMFDGSRDGEAGFHAFLRSLPALEKLDLDGTGSNGGVNDRLLGLLTPAKGETNALTDLRIGYAKNVTPEALIRFIRGCTTLRHLEADNTSATNAVMREFYRRHDRNASISLVDCRAITPVSYSHLSSSSRPRDGFPGYSAIPMAYDEGELDDRVVIKVFWSWRRVGVAKGWRDTLKEKQREIADRRKRERAGAGSSSGAGTGAQTPVGRGARRKGWWTTNDDTFHDRSGCVVQ